MNRLALSLALVAAVAPAWADDAPTQKCAFTDELRGWSDVDDYTVIVDLPAGKYKVTFVSPCRDMQDATAAKFVSRPGICLSSGDRMVFKPRAGLEGVCVIKTVEKQP